MATGQKPGAVLFARDIGRVAKFYESVAGLEIVHDDGEVVVLESDAVQLIVHVLRGGPSKADGPPQRRVDSYLKLVFPVADLEAARNQALALGGELNPASREFEARGFRACDGHDPEGNVLQLRVSA